MGPSYKNLDFPNLYLAELGDIKDMWAGKNKNSRFLKAAVRNNADGQVDACTIAESMAGESKKSVVQVKGLEPENHIMRKASLSRNFDKTEYSRPKEATQSSSNHRFAGRSPARRQEAARAPLANGRRSCRNID